MLRLILLSSLFITFGYQSAFAQTVSYTDKQYEMYFEKKSECEVDPDKVCNPSGGPVLDCKCEYNEAYNDNKKKCEAAVKEYKDLMGPKGELGKSCGSDTATCLKKADVCQACISESDEDDTEPENGAHCEANDDDDYDDDSSDDENLANAFIKAYRGEQPNNKSQSRRQTRADARNTMIRFKNCPVYAIENFDDVVDKKEKYDEDVKSAKEDIPELIKEVGEAQAELTKAQKEQAKLFPELEKDIQKITKNADKTLQAELEKNGKEIIAKLLEIQNTEIAFSQNKDKIIEPCFAKAEAALQNLKTTRNDKIRRGALRAKGGFAGLANNTNKKIYFRNYALGIYQDCLDNNTLIKKSLRTAEALHKQNLKVLQLQMQELQNTQRTIANKMMGTSPNDAMQAELDARNEKFEDDSEKAADAVEKAMRAYQNAKLLLEKRQAELREAEYLFSVYLDQEKVARRSGATKGNKKDVSADGFISAAGSFRLSIDSANEICDCDSGSSSASCVDIKKLLKAAGREGSTSSSAPTTVNSGSGNTGRK